MIKQLARFWMSAVPMLGSLAACTSLHVRSDVNSELVGTIHCHTYSWAGSFRSNSPLRSTVANPINESRLRSAIAASLQATGAQQVATDADCLVGYGIGTRSVVEGAYPYDWGWAGGWGYGWGWGWPGPYVGAWGWPGPYVYQEGIVAVDLYDSKSKKPLWHASVDQNLSGVTGAEADKRIKAAVAALFTKYPG